MAVALTAICLFSCASDRYFIENLYRSHQMSEDLANNREGLYDESFVGVHKEFKAKEPVQAVPLLNSQEGEVVSDER